MNCLPGNHHCGSGPCNMLSNQFIKDIVYKELSQQVYQFRSGIEYKEQIDKEVQAFHRFIEGDKDEIIDREVAGQFNTLNHHLGYLNAIDKLVTQDSGVVTVNGHTRKTMAQIEIDAADSIYDLGEEFRATNKDSIEAAIGQLGFVTIDSFELGATITQRNEALRHTSSGKLYRWAGDLPKVVPASSTPANSGGIGTNAWLEVSDTALRQEILTGGLITDTLVTATAIAPNAVARTQFDKNKDVISVKEFGVAGDALIDDTAAFNAAFNYGRSVKKKIYVPDGTYRVDGTVLLNNEGIAEFSPRATLMRYSAYSTSTEPVFSMRGNHSECSGGRFITQNDSPKGVVTLGHLDNADVTNALWWRIYNPYIQGVQKEGNIGLHIPSGQIVNHDAAANYFGFIVNPIVRYVDEAIVFAEVANSHTVISPQIFQCITGGLNFYGAYGNQIFGGFMHSSRNGSVGVRLMKDRGLGRYYHQSNSNSIADFGVEQGGLASKALVIEEGCVRNKIRMNGNSAGGLSIPDEWSNDVDIGFYRARQKRSFTSINVTGADGSSLRLHNERTYSAKIPTSKEGDAFTIATAMLQNNQSAIYEVNVLARNGALGYNTPKQYKFFVSKGGTGTHVIDAVDVNTTTKHAAVVEVISHASNPSLIEFVLRNRNNGTGTAVSGHVVTIKHIAAMTEPGTANGVVTINEEYINI